MTKTKGLKAKVLAAFAAAAMAFSVMAAPAFADVIQEVEETEATVTFAAGDLVLQTAPSIDFGTNQITNSLQVITATNVSDNIRVSDLRGNASGWSVTAALNEFALQGPNTATLDGAYITVTGAQVENPNNAAGAAPTANQNVQLDSDGSVVEVFTANTNQGMGVWDAVWEAQNTTLTVLPGTAEIGTSVATIDWLIQAAA